MCPKCNDANCSGNCPKSSWKCTKCGGNHSRARKGCPSLQTAISKSLQM